MKKGILFGLSLLVLLFVFQAVSIAEDCCPRYNLRGDTNADGNIDISDLSCLINYVFSQNGGCPGICLQAADVDGDGSVNIGDINYLVNYMFRGGPEPVLCG